MKNKRIIPWLLAASLLASCGGESSDNTATAPSDSNSDPAEKSIEYPYPAEKLGGKFTILNFEQVFGCNNVLDYEGETGEVLNDAKYKRNRIVEDKLGITFDELQMAYPGWGNIPQIIDKVIESTIADDDEFDAALIPLSFKPAVMLDGCLADLTKLGSVDFTADWWDSSINDSLTIDGKLYVASSPFNLYSYDLSWVLLCNESMMENNSLDFPYDIVKSGAWTIEKLAEYVKGAAKLNGADSFAWTDGSPVVYGIAGHMDSPVAMLNSAGVRFLKNTGGRLTLEMTSERLIGAAEQLSTLLSDKNGNVHWNNGDLSVADSYMSLFNNDQALFVTCELKTTSYFRNMRSSYGLLPMPKYDSAQADYVTALGSATGFISVPATQNDMNRVGLILDALSFESYRSVIPVYYDISLSQKGLRNEESIEMLDIIRSTRQADTGNFLGITTAYSNAIANDIRAGGGKIASIAESNKNTVEDNLAKTLKAFE